MAAVLTLDSFTSKAQSLAFRNQAFIGGRYVDAASGKTFDCVNPANGRVLTKVAACDKEDVDRAVEAARAAFDSGVWSNLHPSKRKAVMLRFADLIREHLEELALLETLDMGKPINDSRTIDIPGSAKTIQWYGEAIDKLYDEVAPTDPSALALITKEPLGIVAAVVPWNFPLLMASWKIGPALAAGNSLIVKPAEQSPLTAIRVAELASQAGVPDGVFNVLPGFGETAGQALGRHMDVDCVTFTGSHEVGKLFLKYSGESNMKRVSCECGGKSPNIIMADCPDLELAAKAAAFGIFFNQGEVCNAGSRLIVDRKVKDQVIATIIETGKKLQPNDPLDPKTRMGAIVDKTQLDRVMGYIDVGSKGGAKLVFGGAQTRAATGGYYVEPTIFDQVQSGMKIAQEEIFGPVLSVLDFTDEDEAVRIGNDTIYGLAAAVWTKDITKAHRTARRLRAGTVWVNCYGDGDIVVPFGGYKQSGFGRDKSLHAIEKYQQLKTTWISLGR